MHLAIVYDLRTITVTSVAEDADDRMRYDLAVDGVRRAELTLQRYFQPSVGLYRDGRCAVWGGSDIAVGSIQAGAFTQANLPEPVHALYQVGRGWIAVAEISVYVLNEALSIVRRRIHKEVIVKSYWVGTMLMIEDFAGAIFRAGVDRDALDMGDFEGDSTNIGGR